MLKHTGPDIDTNGHPRHVGNTCQATQTVLDRKSRKYRHTRITSLSSQSSQSRNPCHYSWAVRYSKFYLRRARVRGGLAVTLTSDKSIPPSQANNSSQSSTPNRKFQSGQYSLPIRTSNTCHPSQPSLSRKSSRSRKSMHPIHSRQSIHPSQCNMSRVRVRSA